MFLFFSLFLLDICIPVDVVHAHAPVLHVADVLALVIVVVLPAAVNVVDLVAVVEEAVVAAAEEVVAVITANRATDWNLITEKNKTSRNT